MHIQDPNAQIDHSPKKSKKNVVSIGKTNMEGQTHRLYVDNRTLLANPIRQLRDNDYRITNKWVALSRSLDFEQGLAHHEYDIVKSTSHFDTIKWNPGEDKRASSSLADSKDDGTEDSEAPTLSEKFYPPAEESRENFYDILANRRMYRLAHQYMTIWRAKKPPDTAKTEGDGQFPYVEEDASMMADLGQKHILHSRHKTRRRRHPKWLEICYFKRRWHNLYLMRRRANREAAQNKRIYEQSLGL